MSNFLIRSPTSQSSSYPIVLTRLGGPRSRPNPHLKFVEVLGIEPATSWSIVRHADHKDQRGRLQYDNNQEKSFRLGLCLLLILGCLSLAHTRVEGLLIP